MAKKQARGKRKWFIVKAPEAFNSPEIGEILAREPKNLLGRTIEVSFRDVFGEAKEQHTKIIFKINKVQGDTALTEIKRLYIPESYLQRISRKAKERIFSSRIYETKDNQKLRIKWFVYTERRIQRRVRTALLKQAQILVENYVKKQRADSLFTLPALRTLSLTVKKELKKVYPNNFVIWKMEKV